MNLTFSLELLAELEKAGVKHPLVKAPKNRYHNEFSISAFALSKRYLTALREYMAKDSKTHSKTLQKLSQFDKVMKDPSTFEAQRLDSLEAALTAIVMSSGKDRLLWHTETGLPWLVTGIKYNPGEKDSPATTTLSMVAVVCNKDSSKYLTWSHGELLEEKRSVAQLLFRTGFAVETPEMVEAYNLRMERWKVVYNAHFKQFLFNTSDFSKDSRDDESDRYNYEWHHERSKVNVGTFKVVNDVPILEKTKGRDAPSDYRTIASMPRPFDEAKELADVDDDADADDIASLIANFKVPVHPYVYVFNLETHRSQWVLSDRMFEYNYNKNLVDKLILPKEHKTLVNILTSDADILSADIVAGKSGGTIVMATGEPGLGKSLTAEAFAEAQSMILYRVQSDQLGTSASGLEKNLKEVFARAERWNAVLLIDECDIYVHERGMDIVQNAIVGTLLRTFEYFNGVMFLTTNRDLIIDDAILSRCSAVIRYDYPTDEAAIQLFRIFEDLFEMALPLEVIVAFRKQYPKLSGRTIKNVLRLTVRRGMKTPTLDDLLLSKMFVPHDNHSIDKSRKMVQHSASGNEDNE